MYSKSCSLCSHIRSERPIRRNTFVGLWQDRSESGCGRTARNKKNQYLRLCTQSKRTCADPTRTHANTCVKVWMLWVGILCVCTLFRNVRLYSCVYVCVNVLPFNTSFGMYKVAAHVHIYYICNVFVDACVLYTFATCATATKAAHRRAYAFECPLSYRLHIMGISCLLGNTNRYTRAHENHISWWHPKPFSQHEIGILSNFMVCNWINLFGENTVV